MEFETNKIYQGDVLDVLKTFPDEVIDCVMTSPPYYALRDYGIKGQIGLEKTYKEYVEKMTSIFHEVKRVLKKDGTVWLNIADTYAGTLPKEKEDYGDKSIKKNSKTQDNYNKLWTKGLGVIDKCMMMIPERLALSMIDDGWILRNKICWYKRNSMPTSVKDRFGNKWEYVYLFAKNKRYYFDLDSIRKPYTLSSVNRINAGFSDKVSFNYRVREAVKGKLEPKFGSMYKATEKEKKEYDDKYGDTPLSKIYSVRARMKRQKEKYNSKGELYSSLNNRKAEERANGVPHDLENCNPKGGNPGDLWDITTRGHPFAHFAVYPEELCEKPIKAGSRVDGIVLDPFCGSGTTCLVAYKLKRRFVGIELNPEYIKIAEERLKPLLNQKMLDGL